MILRWKLIAVRTQPKNKKFKPANSCIYGRLSLLDQNLTKQRKIGKKYTKGYDLTFDLQKALPFPTLTCSVAHYKWIIYIYNLGCHELSIGSVYMYASDETVASNGWQEIAFCLIECLQNRVNENIEDVIMFSNSFRGQNVNSRLN